MIWRLVILCAVFASFGAAPKEDAGTDALRCGIQFLLSQQGDDGGWHSTTYGAMRQGAAVTSLVLYALGHLPGSAVEPHQVSLRKACEFLRPGIRKKGYVANPDGSADFPTYASSMLLIAADRLKLPLNDDELQKLLDFVAAAQLTDTRQFDRESIHYGGWDLMGAQHIVGQTSGTNVSISRFAVEALACYESADWRDVLLRARGWSAGIQNLRGDGGFFFTPDADSENNKALADSDENPTKTRRPRPYGTCTCDGVLLLLATGVGADDKRVADGINWIVRHPDVQTVPGFQNDAQATGWQEGLRYYYYAALVKTLPHLPAEEAAARRAALIKVLVNAQRTDGSWKNSSARMREDDPLICTPFAVTALATLLGQCDGDDPTIGAHAPVDP